MRNESGTIEAISTAMSNSGIGIVRMSGEEAVEIAGLAPYFITVSKILRTTYTPPWQLISTVSSPV